MKESPTRQAPILDDKAALEAADAAAAASDAAARADESSSGQEVGVAELQPGPALTTEELEVRLVRLARSIKQPADTEPALVARTLEFSPAPSSRSDAMKFQGALGKGTYKVEISALYGSAPGKHIEIEVTPREGVDCALSFIRLRDQLVAATHYTLSKGPRSVDPVYVLEGTLSPGLKIFITLEVDSHDAPRCVKYVTFDLEDSNGE